MILDPFDISLVSKPTQYASVTILFPAPFSQGHNHISVPQMLSTTETFIQGPCPLGPYKAESQTSPLPGFYKKPEHTTVNGRSSLSSSTTLASDPPGQASYFPSSSKSQGPVPD